MSRRRAPSVPRLRLPRSRRRNQGWVFTIGLLIVVAVVAGIPYFVASEDALRPDFEEEPTKLTLPAGTSLAQLEVARVEEVIDGDTIEVFVGQRRERVRYFGVDTPERGDRCYREAVDRNTTLIGTRVLLLPDQRQVDSFGRLLRYIFLEDGTSVDATLVAEGFGRAWREDGRYRDQIVAIEGEAEVADRGCLWR